MSSAPTAASAADAKTNARKNAPLKNAITLRGIYNDRYEFPKWVLDADRWKEDGDKSHKFDDTIVVYDDAVELKQVKELVEEREPVNVCLGGVMQRSYKQKELETNFGWKMGAYSKSTTAQLYPNIGIYCHARVTNEVSDDAEEKNVHVMNLIGYAFDSNDQPDFIYFLNKYGAGKDSLKNLDPVLKQNFKEELIQRYRKIWLKACYICKFKNLKNLWYYGVGNNNFSGGLPDEWTLAINFYNQIFAEAFGIDSNDSSKLHTSNNKGDTNIPINFCNEYKINVLNLGAGNKGDDTLIPNVLFNDKSDPTKTLYINAWDPWSIIGNENNAHTSLDAIWGRNSNMSVLGWSMTNSKLLPDITGTRPANEKSKILSMKEILDEIVAEGGGSSSPKDSDSTPPPSTPPSSTLNCSIENPGTASASIKNITPECQEDIFKLAKPLDTTPAIDDEPKEMSNLVSAIGTDYSIKYAGENIMPAGSATLLYIGDTELYDVILPSTTKKTNVKIKYMIQASPAKAGNESDVRRDITKDTISNSVMNSLILAAKNGVETIIFPFIGGELFYGALKKNVDTENASTPEYKEYDTDQHAEVLVKGVTDFYTNFSSYGITSENPIKEIYFVTYNAPEEKKDKKDPSKVTKDAGPLENEAIKKANDKAKHIYKNLTGVLKQSTRGNVISNAVYYSNQNKPNIAIVNAANTQLAFGAGVSNMCYAGLEGMLDENDKSKSRYQIKLNNIKTKFIDAFKAYIANPTEASSPPKASTKTNVALANVIEGLVNSIEYTEDDYTIKLGIKPSNDNFIYKYPPPGDASPTPPLSSPPTLPVKKDKNLNSADPAIDFMITSFENATDEGDRDFYLGACRSIEAAYVLEKGTNKDTSNEAMRAKLLLNLRKNSLLLKVSARWDYKEMKPGVEPELTRKPIISKDIIPMELNETTKDDIIQKLVQDFEKFKGKNPDKETIGEIVYHNEILNDIYTNNYTTLLNDISYLNFSVRPLTSASNSLIFDLLAYKGSDSAYKDVASLSNLLEYFNKKSNKAIENIDEYLKTNISDIVDKINKKIITTTNDDTKVLYSDFYKFLLETKRIDILEYILSEHENASDFSGVIRPYYEQILQKEKSSIHDMLKSVDYIFKSGYGDGNCFYNSAGMQIIKPPVEYKKYNLVDRFSEEWWKQQNKKQIELRNKLSDFLLKIYDKVKELQEFNESKLEFIQYLKKYGPKNFDNVSTIKTPISGYYWGTDDELFYISLLYNCFVVILSPSSNQFQTIEYKTLLTIDSIDSSDPANTFKIISDPTRNNYDANGLKSALSFNTKPVVFMVGGGGHWDYAISSALNQSGGSNNIPRPITYTNAANTTHAASKSRHNSSFKVSSSSKSKGKSRSRSHTQRVK